MDFMDPNDVFVADTHEYRIYGDDTGLIYAVVDKEDYQWAVQWRWSPKWSRGSKKVYLRRNLSVRTGEPFNCPDTGERKRNRVQKTLFLHAAIMERKGEKPPSRKHTLIDHRDGDGLNCRRENLRWATHKQNATNRFGSHATAWPRRKS